MAAQSCAASAYIKYLLTIFLIFSTLIVVMDAKRDKFRKLAKQRGNRILNDIRLVGNLSNTNNYAYTDQDVYKIFSTIEQELKIAKLKFQSSKKREIKL